MRFHPSRTNRKAGLTLVELSIGVTLMFIMSGVLVLAMQNMGRLAVANESKANLQTMADDALFEIVEDLRVSSEMQMGGSQFPHVFDGGVPDVNFADHAHGLPASLAEAGDPDAGLDREVIFLLPADADGDGRPDVDGNGRLQWAADEISYTVVTGADGINVLQRRVNGADPRIVGRHVERFVVDTAESSGWTIPLKSMRVRLFFRKIDGNGQTLLYQNEAVVAMRN